MKTDKQIIYNVKLDRFIYGGQAIGSLDSGKKVLVFGGLPDEIVDVEVNKQKSNYAEGFVCKVIKKSQYRVEPKDDDSYISTSPWQIIAFEHENKIKSALIKEAFDFYDLTLYSRPDVYNDNQDYGYRNKVEYSFWYDTQTNNLSLAFYKRGTHSKVAVAKTSLAKDEINIKGGEVVGVLNQLNIGGSQLKTLLIRCDESGATYWQLYVKDSEFPVEKFVESFQESEKFEIIFSSPKSPASVISKRLFSRIGTISDTIFGVKYTYAVEGFFQINLPVYTAVLSDIKSWIPENADILDLYSGVGTIGLSMGGKNTTLVEVNEAAVTEMEQNIANLGINAKAVLATSESATRYITKNKLIIVDPPRAGLHQAVIDRIIETKPNRVIYLSCNPMTQARDVKMLIDFYKIVYSNGYNFFPHTPHIEHLVVLDLKG